MRHQGRSKLQRCPGLHASVIVTLIEELTKENKIETDKMTIG